MVSPDLQKKNYVAGFYFAKLPASLLFRSLIIDGFGVTRHSRVTLYEVRLGNSSYFRRVHVTVVTNISDAQTMPNSLKRTLQLTSMFYTAMDQ